MKLLFTDGECPKFCDLCWNWWIQVQVDNFNRFLFCSSNCSQFFDWNFKIGIVNNLDLIRITRSKNSSPCTMKNIPNFWIFFKSSFIKDVKSKITCSSSYSLSNCYSGILKSCSKSTSTSGFFLPRLPLCLYQNMDIQHSSWSYRKISLVLYQFSSVLHQFSWSLLLTETLLVSFILFRFVFGTKGGILKSLIISLIFFCRYLSSGNIKYSVKLLSKNSKILADISGPTNWRDVLI